MAGILFGNAMRGVQAKLAAFLMEVAGDDPSSSIAVAAAAWKGGAKAE